MTPLSLAGARGFVFDLDGTLVRRGPTGATPLEGAVEVLAAIRASGRPLVVFTNASHIGPERLAAGVRQGGLELADGEVLTPICSAISYLAERYAGARVLLLGTEVAAERMADAGIELVEEGAAATADVVLVAHVDDIELPQLEHAARAVLAGARLLTGNYAPAYAGAEGPIISRGAMVTAAIAKASGRRPTVVGKPSLAAMREATRRLGVPSREIVVTGDDIDMDIALGKLGKSRTVLVRTGISAGIDGIPPARRPDLVVESVADMLGLL